MKILPIYLYFVFGILLVLMPIFTANVVLDPFLVFTKSVTEKTRVSDKLRYVYPNLLRVVKAEAAIFGGSDTFPFRQLDISELFGENHLHLGVEGSTLFEQSQLVEAALKNKQDLTVFWQLNWISFMWREGHSRLGDAFPRELYQDPSVKTRIRYALSPLVFRESMKFLVDEQSLPLIMQMESWGQDLNDRDFVLDFEKNKEAFRLFLSNNVSALDYSNSNMKILFQKYVEKLIEKYPNAKFVVGFSATPYSFDRLLEHEYPTLARLKKKVQVGVLELEKKYPNIVAFDIESACPAVSQDSAFRDFTHFKNEMAVKIAPLYNSALQVDGNTNLSSKC